MSAEGQTFHRQAEPAAAVPAPAQFEAQLVRKGDGTVVYMECDHDLVAQLSAFLHLPIGTLGNQLKPSAPQLGIVHFSSSIAGLRSAVWDGTKERMLPGDRPPTGAKVKTQRVVAGMPPKLCLCGITGMNVQHYGSGRCRLCNSNGKSGQIYHGIDESEALHLYDIDHHLQRPARRVKPDTPTVCSTCKTCSSCAKAIFSHAQNYVALADDSAALAKLDKAPTLPAFKDTVKFLIDNQLRVCENSSVKALQLLSAARVDLSDIVTEDRVVTKAEIHHLVAYMLFNSDKILTSVFPAK